MTLEEALALALKEPVKEPVADPGRPTKSILTAREAEVLSFVAEGLSDIEVAEKLYVSPRTVEWHLRGAYRKLEVGSRTAAIKRAGELGLI
jgi:DNA-binding NarL/FixJ family response regulator